MKKILTIVIIIILFVVSSLLLWTALSPKTFSSFFALYPLVNKTAVQIGVLSVKDSQISQATSSEPVLGLKGQIVAGSNTWDVEIAKDNASRESGLSNRRILRLGQGMLFAFDSMSPQSFWMKDMFIPLDMIFFDNNWKIVLIEANLQPSSFPKIFGNSVSSQYVLEVNAGEADSYGLKVGNQVIFLNK